VHAYASGARGPAVRTDGASREPAAQRVLRRGSVQPVGGVERVSPARLPAPPACLPGAAPPLDPPSHHAAVEDAVGESAPPAVFMEAVHLDERGSLVEASESRVFLAMTKGSRSGTEERLSEANQPTPLPRNGASMPSAADDLEKGPPQRAATLLEPAFGELSSRTFTSPLQPPFTPGEYSGSSTGREGGGRGSAASVLRDSEDRASRESFRV
jgi:hypothetical protein